MRHRSKRKHILLTEQLKTGICQKLELDKWSPELISQDLKQKKGGGDSISHERIYQWIWDCKHSNKRKRAGDIEVDLMMGKNHKGVLLVLTDRATLYTRLKLLNTKESGAAKEGILACLQNSNCPVHTLTFDNEVV